jgi:glycosyltransferase involved in cell wall biosynthesis
MLSARCYVNVSLSDISPNTVLDAIALRLPVILTKNTGLYETLKDSGVCRFIDPFDQKDIESAIIEMCDEQIWSLYKQAYSSFRWPQTWETLFLEYEKALSDILK